MLSSSTRKLFLPKSNYRGRFAPSPTGPLHLGSMVAAVGSYLDAKHHHGTWLVRMEDLDTPRCVPGAAEDILRTLEAFGLYSDEPVIYQSRRTAAYEEALQRLKSINAAYPCCCTRKEITDSALHGIEGPVYPGSCRKGTPHNREARTWRVLTDNAPLAFEDMLQGSCIQHLEKDIGDFVVKRADDLFAYQLAVVVDDAFQNVTHIVRGADLLNSTPRQIHLQHLLGLSTPQYLHLPVIINSAGEKLSKQTLAAKVDTAHAAKTLFSVLQRLHQQPPRSLESSDVKTILEWGAENWDSLSLRGMPSLPE